MNHEDMEHLTSRVGVKGNVRYITITDNVKDHWQNIINIAKSSYTWWAYIFHDSDETDEHLHILCYDEGGTSLKAHCKRFEDVIPSNFVLKVYSPRAMARYLIHKDNPEKHQYDYNLIITNGKDKLAGFFKENNNDCTTEFDDLRRVRSGLMSVNDFLDKYRSEFSNMPFYHKFNIYNRLMDGFNTNNKGGFNETRTNQGD